MTINARVITGLDPGAIPGGSTNPFAAIIPAAGMGPIRIDRRLKT